MKRKKTVIITGASKGIGKAIALEFAKHNWNIILFGFHSPEKLAQTKQEILDLKTDCISFLIDVGNFEAIHSSAKEILNRFSSIDCIINNAGISYIGLLTEMSISDWNTVLSTNLTSVFNFCHTFVPTMLKQKYGKIINISSIWGDVGASCEVAYSATKGGVNSFTKALAKELAPSNIQVNAISCGVVDTNMNKFLDSTEKEKLLEEIPIGRMATPQEVAQFTYLLAITNSYLTGQIIRFDGGLI